MVPIQDVQNLEVILNKIAEVLTMLNAYAAGLEERIKHLEIWGVPKTS